MFWSLALLAHYLCMVFTKVPQVDKTTQEKLTDVKKHISFGRRNTTGEHASHQHIQFSHFHSMKQGIDIKRFSLLLLGNYFGCLECLTKA